MTRDFHFCSREGLANNSNPHDAIRVYSDAVLGALRGAPIGPAGAAAS